MAASSPKVVVITGCSSGIGLSTAVLLAKDDNFKIIIKVIATMRNLQKRGDLEKAAGESLNKSLSIKEHDISKEESILTFLKETYSAEGKIDILINNAAIGQNGPFECVTLDQMQALFQTNFFGTARITQEIVRKMKEQKSGHIIFISSLGGVAPFPFREFYVASKCAIEGLVGCMAPVLRGFNVSVTSVEPGPVQTPFSTNIKQNNQGGLITTPWNNQGEVSDKETEQELAEGEKTTAMRLALDKSYAPFMARAMQTSLDVAEVIKKCIYDEKPHVRIQTSLAIEEMVKEALVDPTGDKYTERLNFCQVVLCVCKLMLRIMASHRRICIDHILKHLLFG